MMRQMTAAAFGGVAAVALAAPAYGAFEGVAYEGFAYESGAPLVGLGEEGSGWGSGWLTRSGGTATVGATDLSAGALATSGNSAVLVPDGENIQNMRALSERIGDDESYGWVSFIGQQTNEGTRFFGFSLYEQANFNATGTAIWGAERFAIGHGTNDGLNWKLGPSSAASSPIPVTELVFALLRIDFTGETDTASLWLNPDLVAGEAGLGTPYATLTGADLSFQAVRLGAGEANASGTVATGVLDEIRVGTSYEAVVSIVPEPASIALLGLGGLAALRRRR